MSEQEKDLGLATRESQFLDVESTKVGRRGFLKGAGFGLAATTLAGCSKGPVELAIPYLNQPEGMVPGRADWYASTCAGCSAGCGLLVKTREGRPIKLEGNPGHPVSAGGLCAVGQAGLVGVYDRHRLQQPTIDGQPASWSDVDSTVMAALSSAAESGARVRILTGTLNGPTERSLLASLLERFEDARHVSYDALSSSAILDAHEKTHGQRLLPRYRFDRAHTIVSFGADFLGTWISPVEFAAAYSRGRSLAGRPPVLSHHSQFESRLSLTGSNADLRQAVAPQQLSAMISWLAADLAGRAGVSGLVAPTLEQHLIDVLASVAERLWHSRGTALVVSDSQNVDDQISCNWINHLLDGYGGTLDLDRASQQRLGDDRALAELVAEIERGEVDVLITRGVNPVYDLSNGARLAEALASVPLTVAVAQGEDETSAHCKVVCPECHELESWSDAEPYSGALTLTQPAIGRLFDSRTFAECLAAWSGAPDSARELVRHAWSTEVHPRSGSASAFQVFWDQAVHDGYLEVEMPASSVAFDTAVRPGLSSSTQSTGYSLVLYPKVSQLDGSHAHNPWLQELPDPISKACWDNYACIAPETAQTLSIETGDLVQIDADGETIEVPALVQIGQDPSTVAVAIGYGRTGTDRFTGIGPQWLEGQPTVGEGGVIGVRANGLATLDGSKRCFVRHGVTVTRAGGHVDLALAQTSASLTPKGLRAPLDGSPRPMVQETVISAYIKDPHAGTPAGHHFDSDLWPGYEYTGHHWGLAVDLNACTGCSACVVACQAENNVPVVGRDEVRRRREMHWIRVDRYYSDEGDVSFQPMMCQQCDNAPCETVCPVVATVHSDEGLNQQVYNRCVGTRYCANNCPYKVRRFNWFNYAHDDLLENLSLNPEVVVRTRGVMEKCTFCVQRIEDRKIHAKVEGRELEDGEIQTACQQSCPAGAIVFGDFNDPESRVSRMTESGRHFRVLEEMNVQPSVGYLRRVRNREEALEDHSAGTDGHAGGERLDAEKETTHG